MYVVLAKDRACIIICVIGQTENQNLGKDTVNSDHQTIHAKQVFFPRKLGYKVNMLAIRSWIVSLTKPPRCSISASSLSECFSGRPTHCNPPGHHSHQLRYV
jgi:hypothetical protein